MNTSWPFLIILGLTVPAQAQESLPPEKRFFFDTLDKTKDQMNSKINSLSADIDSFFSRDETEVENLGSRVQVGTSANFVEDEDPSYNFLLKAKIILPKTQKKLQVIFISDEDESSDQQDLLVAVPDESVGNSVKDQKFSLGLRNVFRKSKTSGVVLDGGVKLRNPIDPFVRLTARKSIFFNEYELRLIDKLYWFESEGWGSSPTIELDRPLTPTWLFRLSNNGVLDHESGLWEFDHYFALYHRVNPRTAMGYFIGITSNDEPTFALQTYYAAINYRYLLYSDWLYFQATPRMTWPREKDWEEVPSVLFKLEAILGG